MSEKMTPEKVWDYISDVENYLANGGLFNPELMDHKRVRDMLLVSRDIASVYLDIAEKLEKEVYGAYQRGYESGYSDGCSVR